MKNQKPQLVIALLVLVVVVVQILLDLKSHRALIQNIDTLTLKVDSSVNQLQDFEILVKSPLMAGCGPEQLAMAVKLL